MPSPLLASLLLMPMQAALPVGAPDAAGADPVAGDPNHAVAAAAWRATLGWLEGQQGALAQDLDRAHRTLRERAERERPELLERLEPEPPRALPTGYGRLPRLTDEGPPADRRPREQRYDMRELPHAFARDFVDASLLATLAGEGDLAEHVTEFERLRGRLRRLDQHVTYHDWWQAAVRESAEFFAERNEALALVERWIAERNGGSADTARELELEVRERVAPFQPTAGLAIRPGGPRDWSLPVVLHTDVGDTDFQRELRTAVQRFWNDSPAFEDAGLAIELELVVHDPAELYADSAPPVRGETIDLDAHLARFPNSALVLTTGARSTHARAGRYVQLGTQDLSRITLAHEFGHLLGFSDAYLRGFRGDLDDPYGVTLVEWRGLVDDLMGDSGGGEVSFGMVRQLFRAYRRDAETARSGESGTGPARPAADPPAPGRVPAGGRQGPS